jgi:hypothetical protein
MATTVQRVLPAEYLEALGKTFADRLTTEVGQPIVAASPGGITQLAGETAEQFAQRQAQAQQFDITKQSLAELAPQVAAQDALQVAAITQATDPTKGLGAFEPFLADARTAATGATALTGPMTAAQRTAFMSPYQTAVIDTTLVQRAEFDAASDRNRAALQAGLLQQGFQQAQRARQQDLQNQIGIANLQSGLGARAQDLARTQIAGLGTLGATQQAQTQAILDAQRAASQLASQERFDRLSQLGSGVIGLMGGSPARTSIAQTPTASPLASALGIGSTLAGIYGAIT